MEVSDYLEKWGVGELKRVFEENDIDTMALALIEDDQIKELIPKVGVRVKFLKGWRKEFQKKDEPKILDLTGQPSAGKARHSESEWSTTLELDSFSLESDSQPSDSQPSDSQPSDSQLSDVMLESLESDDSFQPPPLKREKRVHFDVKSILMQTAHGRKVVDNIERLKYCSKSDRHIMVSLCTDYMVQRHGHKPSSFTKGALAQSIVTCFPCLNDPEAPFGYEAWYCKGAKMRPATGYLEEHLRYIRKKGKLDSTASPSSSKHEAITKEAGGRSKPFSDPQVDPKICPEEATMMVEWMKSNMEPAEKVAEYMRKTAFYRREKIQSTACNVSTILTEFPCLLENGMIEQDFATVYPGKENKLYEKWDKYSSLILDYCKQFSWQEDLNLHVNIGNLTDDERKNIAFFVASASFKGGRSKGRKAGCQLETVNSFIDVLPEVANIEEYTRKIDASLRPQPFIVCRGSRLCPTQAYVILERHALPQPSLLKAVDICFKAIYIMDVDFQPNCKIVWQFLANVIYEFADLSIPSSIRSVRAFIHSK